MDCPSGFSYLFPPKKEEDSIDDLKERTKKKISDLKKEKNKLEKSNDKLDVKLLQKLVDEYKEEDEEDEEKDEEEEEDDDEEPSIVLLLEEMKKKQETTDVQLQANNLIFQMLLGLNEKSSTDETPKQHVIDGQEKRNLITKDILLKAAKVDEIERKQNQYKNLFQEMFGSTPNKTENVDKNVSKRKLTSSSEDQFVNKKKKKSVSKKSTKETLQEALERLKKRK